MRVAKASELPGLTCVDRFVNSVTADNVTANARFSRSHINDIRVRLGNRDGSDRRRRIFRFVEDRFPVQTAISRLPYASGSRPEIIDIILAHYACHRDHAPAPEWTDQAILQTL